MKNLFTLLVALLVCSKAFAQDTLVKEQFRYLPDYAKVQFAGNIGFFSAGFGYLFLDNILHTELLYGHVPATISKAKLTHTITLKNTFSILNKEIRTIRLSPIAGFTGSFETGNNSFVRLPDKYPKGYYRTNAFYLTFFVGAKVHRDFINPAFIKGADLYFEFGTVDTYLWYSFLSKELKIDQIVSMAIGINLFFDK